MNKLFLALSAILATPGGVAAFETPTVYEASAVHEWTGFYLGTHAGYPTQRISQEGASETLDGGLLGVHAGYNFVRNGNWIFGVEGDVTHAWNEEDYEDISFAVNWQWSARGRIGYALERTLIFGAAGIAGSRARLAVPVAPLHIDDTLHGWTLGAGFEHAINDSWRIRAEYRYVDYGKFDLGDAGESLSVTENGLRFGFSRRF
jgi:outer membrane immunogenic protein